MGMKWNGKHELNHHLTSKYQQTNDYRYLGSIISHDLKVINHL